MQSKKILIIDDDPDGIALAKKLLEKNGYFVISASNGPDGLNLLRKENPQLILLDINMPEMNGHQVGLLLQNDFPHIPVMVLTASAKQRDQFMAAMTGAVRYISKSEELQDICKYIDDFFHIRRQSTPQ